MLLGLTSFFTDISSEALTAVLPLYFVLELRMSSVQFGVLDGLYQGASALVRVAGGVWADAGRRYKVEVDIECPSLSPDGRRVAFKHRDGGLTGPVAWRLWVLNRTVNLNTPARPPRM